MFEKKGTTQPDEKSQGTPEAPLEQGIVDSLLEVAGFKKKESEETPPVEPKEKEPEVREESPIEKKLFERLNYISQELEADIKKQKELLPNTKDEAKKLEMERDIWEKEKKLDILKKDLDEPKPEIGEAVNFFKEHGIDSSAESYKLYQKMLNHKGSADLVKLFLTVSKAVASDFEKKVSKVPVDLKEQPVTAPAKPQTGFDPDSITGKILESLKK